MTRIGPPVWMQALLRFLLVERDRETIVGDLYEEFCDLETLRQSSGRMSIWYLLQVVSFAPHRCRSALVQPRVLALLCAFTALCGGWLGAMDLRFRHHGYVGQTGIAAGIMLQALLTLCALRLQRKVFLVYVSMFGCLGLFWLAASALIATFRGADIEGYIVLIALALLGQAALTLCTLPLPGGSGKSYDAL